MLEEIARKENIPLDKLERNVKLGSAVILKNAKRNIEPLAVGDGTHVKINANLGTSPDRCDLDNELKKADTAVRYGADTLMDLSTGGDLDEIRKKIIKETSVPLGTVPIYQAFLEKRLDMDAESILKVIEKNCRDGVDFLTLHCGVTKEIVENLSERLIPITSRGGSFIAAWILKNREENPLYTHYDDILEIAKEYEAAISLGDGLRPACLHDATDRAQIHELVNLGRLTKRAREKGVKVIVEGPGHVPLDQIESNMQLQKRLCDNAPFYVLGPLVTDIALGYDHITGAIGGALAAVHGADFLCYVTPAEHMGLPDEDDVKNGVIASKIAAHAADIVRLKDQSRDDELSAARKKLDWDRMFALCINPGIKEERQHSSENKVCTMCGKYCALKIVEEYLS